MNYLYIVGLTDLEITESLAEPIKTADKTFITNNPSLIKSLIPNWQLSTLGRLEYNFLTCGRPVIYKKGEVLVEEGSHIEVINTLREAHALLTSLWMTKDCSVNCDTGFAIGLNNDGMHCNTLSLNYSLSNGKNKALKINQVELESACELSASTFKGLKEQNNPKHTALQKATGRVNISTYHLQMARSASDLAIKIATYCSFFESLFSTGNTELSHQLSERIAFFLSCDPHERLEIYKKTKKAYGIRSKAVHGDIISSSDLKELTETSKHCDEMARKIYTKIITSKEICELFEGPNELLDSYMRDLIFGVTTLKYP